MDERDIVDDVNALLNLGVGEPYRLEHIKQSFIENKSLWLTDENYLNQLREKYLIKHNFATLTNFEESAEEQSGESVHCWKCGKKSGLGANFCMVCGASIFDVGSENKTIPKETPPEPKVTQSFNLKFPIIIAIPAIILIVLGAAYAQGFFDDSFEKSSPKITETVVNDTPKPVDPNDPSSKCGAGTIFDSETNSCVLENSKCGAGTVYDSETNSCVLG